MPRLTVDPNGEIAPDFAQDEYLIARETIMDLLQMTDAQAASALLTTWTAKLEARKAAWETERADRQRDEEEARRREQAAGGDRTLPINSRRPYPTVDTPREKKPPKTMPLLVDKEAPRELVNQPSRFALNKLKDFDYIELSYFTPEACDSAAKHDFSIGSEAFTFMHVIPDEELQWEQMTLASTSMVAHMLKAHWPKEHLEALRTFYYNIINHKWRATRDGYAALLIYQARVRREWHHQLEDLDGDGAFNIGIINDVLLSNIREEL
ncbi:hypothetical protein FPV67DRAFT_1387749, partial [Lyophyllum atratum]